MLMVIYMMVIGQRIWLMEKESMFILEVQGMRDIGEMIYSMVLELKYGQMEQNMKEYIKMGKKVGREPLLLQMAPTTLVILEIMKLQDMESIFGKMGNFIKVNGKIVK
jgi:hypothetical protein